MLICKKIGAQPSYSSVTAESYAPLCFILPLHCHFHKLRLFRIAYHGGSFVESLQSSHFFRCQSKVKNAKVFRDSFRMRGFRNDRDSVLHCAAQKNWAGVFPYFSARDTTIGSANISFARPCPRGAYAM